MSREFRKEVYREGFITALCGIRASEEYINTYYKMEYIEGRADGNHYKDSKAGLRARNIMDQVASAAWERQDQEQVSEEERQLAKGN